MTETGPSSGSMGLLNSAAPAEHRGAPRQTQSQHIAEIVSGVGQQGHGIAHQAIERLDDDEAEIERDADGEGFAETRRRMSVRMAVIMTVVVMRVAAMVVGHRHRLPINRRRHREERSDAAIQGP